LTPEATVSGRASYGRSDAIVTSRPRAISQRGLRTPECLVSSHLAHRSDAPAGGPIDQKLIAPLRDLGDNDFRELIRMFLDEAAGRVARLQAIQQQGATHALAGVSHALKGTSAAFGATRLAALCAEIEDFATGTPSADLAVLVNAVAVEFDQVRKALLEEIA